MKGDSLRRQLAKAERFALQHELELDTSLRDLGVSAYTGQHRKKGALSSFLSRIKAGEIAVGSWLIVENIDRLSRENAWDAFGMIREIVESGITIASLVDDMIYDLPTLQKSPQLFQTLHAVLTKGHRESADKADRLQEVWAEKRAAIMDGGRKKLTRQGPGWLCLKADDAREPLVGDWEFNDQAQVVKRAFAYCIDGLGKEAIVRRFNSEGLGSFKGGDGWNASTLAMLLSDRRTIGELQLYTKAKNGPRREIGEPIKGYFATASGETVVSEEVFYRAQAEIAKRYCGAKPGKTGRVPNLFVGISRCQCGRSMEFRNKQGKRNRGPSSVYLTCSGNRRGHICDISHRFTYDELEHKILRWVSDIKLSDAEATEATKSADKMKGKEAERDNLKRRLDDAFVRWEEETDQSLRKMLYETVQRHSAALPKVESEIQKLLQIVRQNTRSGVEDRRATVRRIADRLRNLEGNDLFEMRAKLASALRQVIDHIEFQADGGFTATVVGGLKLYHFSNHEVIEIYDLTDNSPDASKLLTFPTAMVKDARNWEPMTLGGIRETLQVIAVCQITAMN
jgi:DNA invertase Pin-like site-specific DNA recombinase